MSAIATIAGSAILKQLAPIAVKAGAPILADLLKSQVGDTGGKVIDAVADRLGVPPTPEAIVARHSEAPAEVEATMRKVAEDYPEYWSMLAQADAIRADLLRADQKEAWWAWAWRPFWMWLLGAFWIEAAIALLLGLAHIDFATLITLTGMYLALYMGGHTVKDAFGKWAAARRS